MYHIQVPTSVPYTSQSSSCHLTQLNIACTLLRKTALGKTQHDRRLIRVPVSMTFAEFQQHLDTKFHQRIHKMQYTDPLDVNFKVNLADEEDWENLKRRTTNCELNFFCKLGPNRLPMMTISALAVLFFIFCWNIPVWKTIVVLICVLIVRESYCMGLSQSQPKKIVHLFKS